MANSKNKKTAKKVAMKDTLAKITKTAKTVNKQVTNTATEVLEDVTTNGKYWRAEATKSAKEMVTDFDVNKGLTKVKKVAKNANAYSLEVADGLVEAALENGKDWQVVASKAVKGGLKLADKQQDIFFDTLELMKGQFTKSAKRFQKLVRSN